MDPSRLVVAIVLMDGASCLPVAGKSLAAEKGVELRPSLHKKNSRQLFADG